MQTQIIEYDERQGVPSASKLLRLKLCPGSYTAEIQCGCNQQSNPDAERGSRIHAAIKSIAKEEEIQKVYPDVNSGEIEEAWKLFGIYQQIEAQVCPEINDEQMRIIEERFWLVDENGEKLLTGQIDAGIIFFNPVEKEWEALICDFKTGWGEVDEAADNLQMRAYAVLLKVYRPSLRRITVGIIAPHRGRPTLCQYTEEDLERAKAEIMRIRQKAVLPNAPRIAGPEQCKYCPAKSSCREYKEAFLFPVVAEFPLTVRNLSPEQKARCCEKLPEFEKWLKKWKSDLKEEAKDGNIPGWRIGKGRKTRTITNFLEAYRRVSKLLSKDQFAEACSVSLPELEKTYKRVWDITEEEAKLHLAERLNELIEVTESEGSLEKIK